MGFPIEVDVWLGAQVGFGNLASIALSGR